MADNFTLSTITRLDLAHTTQDWDQSTGLDQLYLSSSLISFWPKAMARYNDLAKTPKNFLAISRLVGVLATPDQVH
jgi:hypothetical protein